MKQTTKERVDVRKTAATTDTEDHQRTEEQESLLDETDNLLSEIDDLLDEPEPEAPVIFDTIMIERLFAWAEENDLTYDLVIVNGVIMDLVFPNSCVCA